MITNAIYRLHIFIDESHQDFAVLHLPPLKPYLKRSTFIPKSIKIVETPKDHQHLGFVAI